FGLTNATESTWSKSTTFMACAAHGCLPVITSARPSTPPLRDAVAAEEVGMLDAAELAQRRAALTKWYSENADWKMTARKIAGLVHQT
ncbi:MAG: hypothetical protein M3Y86_11630, partial [Verrucomicrobiota bacterium]|nr:hypothetical protein [Verrucomicrobiota bacterium]